MRISSGKRTLDLLTSRQTLCCNTTKGKKFISLQNTKLHRISHLRVMYFVYTGESSYYNMLRRVSRNFFYYSSWLLSRFRHQTQTQHSVELLWARSRELHLTSHNIHKGQTSMSLVGFEPAVPPSDRPQTHALESAATGTGILDS